MVFAQNNQIYKSQVDEIFYSLNVENLIHLYAKLIKMQQDPVLGAHSTFEIGLLF